MLVLGYVVALVLAVVAVQLYRRVRERARAAGMPVTLHIDGHPRPVDPGLELSAYRIVQEALTNVHKHAGGAPASVRIAWSGHALLLRVRDTGMRTPGTAEDADGHGL